ncbi:NHL repeat containing protein [Oopsacas minuta]|uniref:NHL repeat containing protein n=1 Tax=Oopsacas minuta TaxID=111878 RepID=A0AAV7JJC0_9METZ|nr:NHL repeat containing protein [Oopsacas minuta]
MATAHREDTDHGEDNFILEIHRIKERIEIKAGVIDYTNKKQPLVSICERGKGNEELSYPCDVTVDNQTGNIYITDTWNNCIKVFDSTAKYLFEFGDSKGEGAMKHAICLSIYGNRVLISQEHCILNYIVDGKFISKVDLCYKTKFGINTLKEPQYVKLSKEYIYVLDTSNPCIHLFNRNLKLQKSIISRGKGNQVIDPRSFFIDNSDFILIADNSSDAISMFNPGFKFVHKIPVFNNPLSVTVDNQNRVIVVCYNNKNCLQIF